MSQTNNLFDPKGHIVHIGLSAIIGLTAIDMQNLVIVKGYALGASGSLYMGGSTTAVGLGYPIAASEVLKFRTTDQLYFAASGNTCSIAILQFSSAKRP